MLITTGNSTIQRLFDVFNYNAHRIIEISFLIFIAIIISITKIKLPKNYFILITFSFFLIFGLISSLHSDNPEKSITGYWLILSLLLTTILYQQNAIKDELIAFIATLITACFTLYVCIFYVDLCMDYIYKNSTIKQLSLNRGFDNPRFLNHIQTLCIPFAVIADKFISDNKQFSSNFKKLIKALLYLSTSSYIALIFMTAGRGTIISSIVGLVFIWILVGNKFNYVGKRIVILWLIGLTLYAIQVFIYPIAIDIEGSSVTNNLARFNDSGRLNLWLIALEQIKQYPYFGVGPLMYGNTSATIYHSPHNVILWFASEWGIIASFAILSLAVYLLFTYLRRLKEAGDLICLANTQPPLSIIIAQVLGVSLIAGSIHSLVSGLYIIPSSQLTVLLVIILSISSYQNLSNRSEKSSRSIIHLNLPMKFTISLFLLLLLIPVYQYHEMSNWGYISFENRNNKEGLWLPGYWIDGDF